MDMADINATIGANLQALRRQAGLSQQEVAALFGLTYQQMQKYEKGRSRVPASMLARLHTFYDVPYATFFSGIEGNRKEKKSENDSYDALKAKIAKIVAILAD